MNSTLYDMLTTLTKLDQSSTDPDTKESIQTLMGLLISDQQYGLFNTSILNDSTELNKKPDKLKLNFEGE